MVVVVVKKGDSSVCSGCSVGGVREEETEKNVSCNRGEKKRKMQ